ncbi:MAG: DNA polymerase I [bacterium]
MADQKTLIILDSNALLHRAWHALPPTMKSPDGTVVNAVYGFTSMLMKLLTQYKPDYVAACFDLKDKTFRHHLAESYKATREKKPDELYAQIPLIKEILNSLKIPIFSLVGFEADDCVGTIAKQASKKVKVLIVTGDQDEFQLVDDRIRVLYLKTGISEMVEFGPEEVREKFGFDPIQLIDYKALRGDVSDNIKGVEGIGEKTATELIKEFGTVENIFKTLKSVPEKIEAVAKSRGVKALEGQDQVALDAKKLTTILLDVPLEFSLDQAKFSDFQSPEFKVILERFEFRSLLNRLNDKVSKGSKGSKGDSVKATKKISLEVVNDAAKIPAWLLGMKAGELSIVLGDAEGGLFATGQNLGLASGSEAVTISEELVPKLKNIFENEKIFKITYRAKELMHLLDKYAVRLGGLRSDILIEAYLVLAGSQNYDLEFLSRKYLGRNAPAGLAEKALTLQELSPRLEEQIQAANMEKLYREMELPLIPVLFEMERAGIGVDVDYLKELSVSLTKKLNKLEKKIIELAGAEFNVNSPAQLADVLFVTLGLPTDGIKKTKTGFSTAAPELEKIIDEHPIINFILEQRELQKLLTTYVEVMPNLVARDGRIHTTYQQAVTSTGRLSSTNPNLQNIPIQSELANEVRKAFVPAPGSKLLAADYSQIQLRIAAAVSRDKNMMEAFKSGQDIHTATASRVFGVAPEAVTPLMRRQAKVINFGILYGMGAQALGRGTGMTLGEARTFIAKYFETHPGIKSYLDETKLLARTQGYVETIFGRRRYFPDINSGIPMLQKSAERMAINMPIQGAEADIMKLAMLKVQAGLSRVSKDSRLILQVHDELVLEVPEAEIEKVAKFLKATLENVVTLEVPVEVNLEVGDNWGEMEEII